MKCQYAKFDAFITNWAILSQIIVFFLEIKL